MLEGHKLVQQKGFRMFMRVLATVLTLAALPAFAVPAVNVNDNPSPVTATLVTPVDAVAAGQDLTLGLNMDIAPGWHVYWKNAGDSGFPPSLTWQEPAGLAPSELRFPTPMKLNTADLISYAYEDHVLLPFTVKMPATLPEGSSVALKAKAEWLMCAEICVPGEAELSLILPVADAMNPGPKAHLFEKAEAKMPRSSSDWVVTASLVDQHLKLRISPPAATSARPEREGLFLPLEDGVIDDMAPQLTSVDGPDYLMTIGRDTFHKKEPGMLTGVLKGFAPFDMVVNVPLAVKGIANPDVAAAQPQGMPVAAPALGLLGALGFALLGGLILNLMPCVLPVLSLKTLSVVRHAHKGDKVWKEGVAYTAGILVSFWVLAGTLLALKAGGEQLGWGFQLQNPVFVLGLALLMVAVALNLFGVFDVGAGLGRLGGLVAGKKGLAADFLAGVLATVVATPCTAPFMGAALGFALAQPAAETLLVFTALGLGLALPYLVLTLVPGLLRFVPKPGPWMDTFRQFLGFPMLGTAVWLAWVLGNQQGADGVFAFMVAALGMAFGLWLYGQSSTARGLARTVRRVAAAVAVAGSAWAGMALMPGTTAGPVTHGDWVPFTAEALGTLQAERKPGFVVFTAAWCITCKANERLVLRHPDVAAAFAAKGVTVLVADWTNRDPVITETLARYGRSGVPFYLAVPAQGDPIALPELITVGLVKEVVSKL
jgi:thiol:disulfide interchange protein/DsbC/DsbD-like thiol-disulfide interchange protein